MKVLEEAVKIDLVNNGKFLWIKPISINKGQFLAKWRRNMGLRFSLLKKSSRFSFGPQGYDYEDCKYNMLDEFVLG